jgi:hypothetical protein
MKKLIYGAIFFVAFAFAACEKEDSLPTRFTPIPAVNTNVKFLMMSPDAPSVNFIANGQKATSVTPTLSNVVLGLGFPAIYPATIGYTSIPSGAIKIDAKVPDSSTTLPGQTVFTSTTTFAPNKYYTYALVDSLSKLSSVVVEDDPTVADASKAYFRIANFIPNSAVKVEVIKTSSGNPYTSTYNSIAFKAFTAYDTLGAGAGQTYRIFLRHPVTNVKLDSISGLVPINTKKYTIYCRGVFGQSGSTNTRRPIITNYINF